MGTWSGKITKYISTFKLENYCTSLFGLEVAHYGLVGGDGWLLRLGAYHDGGSSARLVLNFLQIRIS